MLLRSSSTPVLGSLMPSFSESPNNSSNNHHQSHELHGKLPCIRGGSSQLFGKSTFHSSPLPESKGTNREYSLIRRVQSEGNLEEMEYESYNPFEKPNHCKKISRCTLEAIPSFSPHNLGEQLYNGDEEEESEDDEYDSRENEDSSKFKKRDVNHEAHDYSRSGGEGKMYLATGLGISGVDFIDGGGSICGGGGSGGFRRVTFDMEDSGGISMEEHYKKMLEENPGNPLVLRNYAQFLYQRKGDLNKAEEYYSRAILADPQDGEVLSQYAKVIWELHGDKERAENYFDRAVQASSSKNSHVHAAYANFLWDVDDGNDDDGGDEGLGVGKQVVVRQDTTNMASATA